MERSDDKAEAVKPVLRLLEFIGALSGGKTIEQVLFHRDVHTPAVLNWHLLDQACVTAVLQKIVFEVRDLPASLLCHCCRLP